MMALIYMEEWTFGGFMDTAFFLEDHFGCEVDLVPLRSIRKELKPYILPEIIYAKGL